MLHRVPWFREFSETYFDIGRVGVVAFFLVSGFIISVSLDRTGEREFLIKRVFRLYPAYFVALTVMLVVAYGSEPWTSPAWLAEVAINYTMLQQLVGLGSLLGPAWTLSIEWVYYAQQVIAKRRGRLAHSWKLGYAWLAVYVTMNVAERVLGHELPATMPLLLATSALGHAAYQTHQGILVRAQLVRLGSAIVVGVALGAWVGLDDPLWNSLNYPLSYFGGLALFAFAFACRNVAHVPALVWLGTVSYSFYLLATPVRVTLDHLIALPMAWLTAVNLVVALVAARLLYATVEQPFNAWGRRLARK
ncbi:acyltransferase family protein [Demequina mangrovi]|uniref:acyltransferase family protein n=1 Tax=Demequina mangrovi TaxID=1043493 RepID=UPI000A5FE768|nr:acyltransferase [Demequina mangrovi]